MDFVVGRTVRVSQTESSKSEQSGFIEAKILHVREPRRRRSPDPEAHHGKERRAVAETDPPGARVLVMLVPDAYRLPEDIDQGEYRVFLRITRR